MAISISGSDQYAEAGRFGVPFARTWSLYRFTSTIQTSPAASPRFETNAILFPWWFGPLEGRAATWAPIGLVIVGGLTTSTFLTLLVIPTIYSLVDDLTRWVRRVAGAI